MTAAALICAMAAGRILLNLWRYRDSRGLPMELLRALMPVAFGSMTIRTGVEAVSLWGWEPREPGRPGATSA